MPFDPSQFVFQPRPLQQYDFGQGFRDVIEARRGKQNTDLLRQQANDTNTRFAATFAKDQGAAEYDKANAKVLEGNKLAEAIRSALQGNELSRAHALAPGLVEAGGRFEQDAKTGEYFVEAPKAPTRAPLDFQGMRNQIFGGGGPSVGQPFQTPGFGAGGERNPFDSPATPGASAAAAGSLPGAPASPSAAPPYPGRVGMQPPEGVEPQLTGPNPMNPPTFSPYRINMTDVVARNQAQLRPIVEGIQNAAPPSGINIEELNRGVLESGQSPDAAFKNVYDPALKSLISLENGRNAALAAQGRLDQSRTNADTAREDKLRKEAQTNSYRIIQNDDLKKIKTKLNAAKDAASFADAAVHNPNAANTLVTKLYTMNEDGLITNQDFTRTSHGMQSIVEAIKNGTLNALLLSPTGINPSMRDNIKAVIKQATQNQQRVMKSAADKMYQMYKSAPTEGERRVYEDGFRLFFDPEFYPPEIAEPWEMGVPGEEPTGQELAPDNVGRAPLPKTLDGRPKVSPNGVPLEPGTRQRRAVAATKPAAAAKPATKPVEEMTEAELDEKTEEELMEMFRKRMSEKK